MHRVTGGASFAHGFVLEHKRPVLLRVASGAGLIHRRERGAHALYGRTFVWIVAVIAAQLSFHDRVVEWQVEFAPLIKVAVKTNLG